MATDSSNGGDVGADNSLQAICYNRGSLRLLDQVVFAFCFFIWVLFVDLLFISFLFNTLFKHVNCVAFEQRKLPLETVYLDIKNAADGW